MNIVDEVHKVKAETRAVLTEELDKFFDMLADTLQRAEDHGAEQMRRRAAAACYSNRGAGEAVLVLARAADRIANLPLREPTP